MDSRFSESELQCGCKCGFGTVEKTVFLCSNGIRDHLGKPVVASSVCRCPMHNIDVEGARSSLHLPYFATSAFTVHTLDTGVGGTKNIAVEQNLVMAGYAMDLQLAQDDCIEAAAWMAAHFPRISIGWYDWGLHIDSRYKLKRGTVTWDNRSA